MSEAVQLYLHRVVFDQALPFELKVPNAKTLAAMNEAESMPPLIAHVSITPASCLPK
jgi:antitoxin component of RelBE/YafQ-DinJ toxin-antitoxin module